MRDRLKSIFAISSVRSKIMIIIISLIFIPSFFMLLFTTVSYRNYVTENTIDKSLGIIGEIDKNIDNQLSNYRNLTLNLYYNEKTKKFIDGNNYEGSSDEIRQYITGMVNSEKYISGIVLDLGGTLYSAGYTYTDLKQFYNEHAEEVSANRGRIVWIPTERIPTNRSLNLKSFVLARAINNASSEQVGYLWVFFEETFFDKVFSNQQLFSGSDYYLVASDGTIVSSNYKSRTGDKLDQDITSRIDGRSQGYFELPDTENHEEEIVVYKQCSEVDWKLINVTRKKIAFAKIHTITMLEILLFGIYLFSLAFTYIILNRQIFVPLNNLKEGLQKVSRGIFDYQIEVRHEDEIGDLTRSYNSMTEMIKQLIDNIVEEEKEKNDAKMKALAMQISPHFLFNSLNTVKWLAVANKQDSIYRMIDSLVRILQDVAYNQNEEITLRDEIKSVEAYVYIQQMRFLNIEVRYEIPEEAKELYICKFIIQPILENAFMYAFKKAPSGRITLTTRIEDALYIVVSDNGQGFDITEIDKKARTDNKPDHIGLVNVKERIQLLYGNEYGLAIESTIHVGTQVTLKLPIIRKEEKND
jgi:two-component system sensor histidine kinase YesM